MINGHSTILFPVIHLFQKSYSHKHQQEQRRGKAPPRVQKKSHLSKSGVCGSGYKVISYHSEEIQISCNGESPLEEMGP